MSARDEINLGLEFYSYIIFTSFLHLSCYFLI